MKNLLLSLLALLVSTALVAAERVPGSSAPPAAAKARAKIDASAPIAKTDDGTFLRKHQSFLQRAKEGPIGLLFLGDSITEGWGKAPDVWRQYYGKYQPANFGIGGDATQHVIWRIENGELDGINPRVVVLMLGTNNTGVHTAEEIAAADEKIVRMIRSKLPKTKVLVLGVFPRGPRKNRDGSIDDGVRKMEIIHAINTRLARLDDGRNIRYLDIGKKFLGADGKIPDSIMPDQLHPNAAGYKIWAEAMNPLLESMMKD